MKSTYDEFTVKRDKSRFREWTNKLFDLRGIKKRIANRTSVIEIVGSGFNWNEGKQYQKNDFDAIVEDNAFIRAALSVKIDAVTGTKWKYRTIEKDSKDVENEKIKKITEWSSNPEHPFIENQRRIFWSLYKRGNVFIEIVPVSDSNGADPWYYVLDAKYCELIWNKKNTKVTHLLYTPPGKDLPVVTVNGKEKKGWLYDNKHFVHIGIDQLTGSEEGVSPLQTLIDPTNLYVSGNAYLRNLYRSGGLGRQIFILEEGGDSELETMKAEIKNPRGNSYIVLGKVKVQPLSITPKDLHYEAMTKHFMQTVMSLLKVPPIMMSMPGASLKETSKSEMNAFSSGVRADKQTLERIQNIINKKCWDDGSYDGIVYDSGVWVDPFTQIEIYKMMTEIGAITPNEIRDHFGLEDVEWGDIVFNFNLWPQIAYLYDDKIEMPSNNSQTVVEPEENAGEEEKDEEEDAKLKILWDEYIKKQEYYSKFISGVMDYEGRRAVIEEE